MNPEFRLEGYTLNFVDGLPPEFAKYVLPEARVMHASGPWGIMGLQEIRAEKYLLRHFLFSLQQALLFYVKEKKDGLQSLLGLKGVVEYGIGDWQSLKLRENEFVLVDVQGEEPKAWIPGGRLCSILNTHYEPDFYADFLSYFPQLKGALNKSARRSYFLLLQSIPARYTVHDAIQAIWFDRYTSSLRKKHIEIRLESALFTLLAQTYSGNSALSTTVQEREKAHAARDLILQNIRVHLTPEQIASQLYCSAGWLKKAFSKVYGIGLFHFLRRTRMEFAREMLLNGETLKAAAIEVGMKPRNFPKEFKAFFGYTVTALKKGLRSS